MGCNEYSGFPSRGGVAQILRRRRRRRNGADLPRAQRRSAAHPVNAKGASDQFAIWPRRSCARGIRLAQWCGAGPGHWRERLDHPALQTRPRGDRSATQAGRTGAAAGSPLSFPRSTVDSDAERRWARVHGENSAPDGAPAAIIPRPEGPMRMLDYLDEMRTPEQRKAGRQDRLLDPARQMDDRESGRARRRSTQAPRRCWWTPAASVSCWRTCRKRSSRRCRLRGKRASTTCLEPAARNAGAGVLPIGASACRATDVAERHGVHAAAAVRAVATGTLISAASGRWSENAAGRVHIRSTVMLEVTRMWSMAR